MPVDLDSTDEAILKSLMEDGRKSFRAISREIKVSTPTVKARYQRLINIGLIKAVKPELDLRKVNSLTMRRSSNCKIKRSTSMSISTIYK